MSVETDEPLWHDEIIEHFDALGELAHGSSRLWCVNGALTEPGRTATCETGPHRVELSRCRCLAEARHKPSAAGHTLLAFDRFHGRACTKASSELGFAWKQAVSAPDSSADRVCAPPQVATGHLTRVDDPAVVDSAVSFAMRLG